MKFIKRCPFFLLLLGTGLLFSALAIAGKNNVYAAQSYDPLKAPILSVLFTGVNDDIYPWQIFTGQTREAMAQADSLGENPDLLEEEQGREDETIPSQEESASFETDTAAEEMGASGKSGEDEGKAVNVSENEGVSANAIETEKEAGEEALPPIEPLRESTRDEYLNHISADIYGDAGVLRAAEYEFSTVDESYFDDAMFIGDSRTVGLRDYTDLTEHSDFFCETSLTIYKVMEEDFKGKGTIENALASKDYGKIYLMVGINELGRGTTEDFMAEYTKVVQTLRQLEPEAKIFIQGVMRVTGDKNSSDAIYNNSNINARNNAIATLADNQNIFYIDVNEVVCDEEGNLNTDYTFDQIHLLGTYNDLWKQFLLEHGVENS